MTETRASEGEERLTAGDFEIDPETGLYPTEVRPQVNDLKLRLQRVTPEEEAAFEDWLRDPEHQAKWEAAIEEARSKLSDTKEAGP